MKVTNPNPCLVNVLVDDDYVRIGPNQTADVPEKAIAALLKTGALVAEKASNESASSDSLNDPANMKAGELKAALDKLGVDYAGNASTEVLRDLYEAKLTEQAGQ